MLTPNTTQGLPSGTWPTSDGDTGKGNAGAWLCGVEALYSTTIRQGAEVQKAPGALSAESKETPPSGAGWKGLGLV